jgi:hypothetical protein
MAASSQEKSEFIDMVVKEAMSSRLGLRSVFDGHAEEYLPQTNASKVEVVTRTMRLAIMRSVLST